MPRVGSSRIITFGFVSSHLLMTTFCWLPPESDDAGVSTDGARMLSRCRNASAVARSSVRRDRERHDESELSPVLGAIGDTPRHGVTGTGHSHRSPVELDLAPIRGS